MPREIKYKTTFLSLMSSGFLGNKLRIWETDEELIDAVDNGFYGFVGVRCKAEIPSGPYVHHVSPCHALLRAEQIRKAFGYPVFFQESSPDEFIIAQGEFCEFPGGGVLNYSTLKTHMREAIKESKHVTGPGARLVLKSFLNDQSYDDIMELSEIYNGAVIEFTAYEILLGNLKGRNYICWEVRNY